jgi:hypothetical protein
MKDSEMKYEHEVYGSCFGIKCYPDDQSANVINYLITGYPLSGKALDGVVVEFLDGEHAGKKAIFETSLYEIIEGESK